MERLFIFKVIGGNGQLTWKQASSVLDGFKKAFFGYLNRVGHVLGMELHYVTTEEYQLWASDQLFMARVALQQLTDSWLLLVGDDSQSKIKTQHTLFSGTVLLGL